jgi:uncharacterized membrane protein
MYWQIVCQEMTTGRYFRNFNVAEAYIVRVLERFFYEDLHICKKSCTFAG